MTPFSVHPEGVEVIKDFGLAALALACVALRFSSLPGDLFVALIQRVTRDFEPPSTQSCGMPDKRALQKENRRVREQVRRAFRETNQRMRREQSRRRLMAFDCFAGIIVAYLLIDWLLIPEPHKMPQEQRWPIALNGVPGGYAGDLRWDTGVGRARWLEEVDFLDVRLRRFHWYARYHEVLTSARSLGNDLRCNTRRRVLPVGVRTSPAYRSKPS